MTLRLPAGLEARLSAIEADLADLRAACPMACTGRGDCPTACPNPPKDTPDE
jgi:hypothetical protein